MLLTVLSLCRAKEVRIKMRIAFPEYMAHSTLFLCLSSPFDLVSNICAFLSDFFLKATIRLFFGPFTSEAHSLPFLYLSNEDKYAISVIFTSTKKNK